MRTRLPTLVLSALVIALPTLLTVLLLTLVARLNLNHYIPSHVGTFNDGIYYWRQAYTFSQAGLNGGYYTLQELAASARFSHFYFYGPIMPMIYGISGRLFGWYPISLVVVNHALVTLGLLVFVVTIRSKVRRLLMLALLLLTFWPLTFFLPLTMQEGLHYTIALLLAAGFVVLIKKRDNTPLLTKVMLFLLLVLAAQLRILWAFFFLPYFILISKNERLPVSLFKGLLCAALCFAPFIYMSAPYFSGYLSRAMRLLTTNPAGIVPLTVENITTNIRNLFTGSGQQLILRLQAVLLIFLCLFDLKKVQRILKQPRSFITELKNTPVENILNATNLIAILLASVILYEVIQWREIRTIAPHVLFTLLLLLAFRHYRVIFIILIVGLLALPNFIRSYQVWGETHSYDEQAIMAFPESVKDVLTADTTASNAWCNTLLIKLGKDALIYPELMYIPTKIGISFFIEDRFLAENTIKSKYVLIPEDVYTANADHLKFELLKTTSIGNLYLNPQAECTSSG